MRKILALLLALTLLVGVAACGGDKPESKKDSKTTTANATATTDTTNNDGDGNGDATTTTATNGDATDTTASAEGTEGSSSATTGGTTTTKPTQPEEGERRSFRLLAIGDGMAADAVQTHLYGILKTAGYTDIRLGILYADKSTIDSHLTAIQGDKATYQYRENTSGKWVTTDKVAPSKAFKSQWDYVVLQQSGGNAGVETTYSNLSKLTALVQNKCGDASLYWHMTWAFRQGSKQEGFQQYYNNQQLMFQSIISVTLKQVMRNNEIMALIPSATAIQNLRTSTLRDTLNSDGARLTDSYGDYTAALTWYCSLTGESADSITYRPSAVTDHYDEIVEAVDNALSVPNQITPASKGDGVDKSISILAVGNSFSIDAMHNHLYEILEAAGYDDIRLGILYVGGCSIDMHYGYLKNDSASYEYLENIGGKWTNTKEYKASTAFALTDWDYVVVQQVSGYSGRPDSYGNLDALVDLIQPQIGKAKLYWQMTWAYQQNSTHGDFKHYGNDQMTMYNAIVSTVKEKIVGNPDFAGFIPSGTAIQNLRTSSLGDTLTADGYHLEDTIGDYTAALTWFCTLTGEDPFSTFYYPTGAVEHFYEMAEAVENAVKTPDKVTPVTN